MNVLITSVFKSASDRLAVSSSHSSIFGVLIYSFIWAVFFFVPVPLLHWTGQSLRYSQEQGNQTHCVWCYVWGRDPRGNNATYSALDLFSFQLSTSRLGPSGADSQVGGFVYILTGGALGIHQGWQPTLLCCGAVCGGGV